MNWHRLKTHLTASLILLSSAFGASAQTTPCAPAASANLPVVNTGLPVVQIWTTNAAPVVDKDNYLTACLRIRDGSVLRYGQGLYHGNIKIKGRGNTTWNMPKKSYRLKLDAASQVLDMPAHKDWVLLANYADKSLMRTALAMEFSRRLGFPWTPRLRFAEVYLNDEFLGNYQLGEKIEVAPSRVAVTEMTGTDNAAPAVTGGYLLEVDYLDRLTPDDRWFTTTAGLSYALQSPAADKVTTEQMAYVSQYVQQMESAILAADSNTTTGYPVYIDKTSLVRYYILQELLKNKDAAMGSSVYLHKQRGGKFVMGPPWDFDISAGNIDFYPDAMGPTGWYLMNSAAWFDALMRRDPTFKAAVVTRWRSFRWQLWDLNLLVESYALALNASQKANFQRWPILGSYVWPNQYVGATYRDEVNWLKNWLNTRVAWIDANVAR